MGYRIRGRRVLLYIFLRPIFFFYNSIPELPLKFGVASLGKKFVSTTKKENQKLFICLLFLYTICVSRISIMLFILVNDLTKNYLKTSAQEYTCT
jgi:hypothetical protein